MARYKADILHIDIEEQDYPDADCKFMISIWHTPTGLFSRELIAIGLSANMQCCNQQGIKEMLLRVLQLRMQFQYLMEMMSIFIQDFKAISMKLMLIWRELTMKLINCKKNYMAKIIKTITGEAAFVMEETFESEDKATEGTEPTAP